MKKKLTIVQPVVQKSESVTSSERYLRQLCDRSFLSLWSYPSIYRDQGRRGKGDGKEVCDLLVVFGTHILIFSDKECAFPTDISLEIAWQRWYRKAIESSAHQVWGAERWIKEHQSRLFLDRKCSQRFPLELPAADKMRIHRLVVAHGAATACRQTLGGSGSLIIDPRIIGRNHMDRGDGCRPFAVGQIDPARGFVHVLDDTTLGIVLSTLDTISDLVSYLTKREGFIQSGRLGFASGEEELLAHYLKSLNGEGQHDFVVPRSHNAVFIGEGLWEEFVSHPQRKAQLDANRVSYVWDALIETFSNHILNGTSHFNSHTAIADREKIMRFLAGEGRTRRRLLAEALLGIMKQTEPGVRGTRIVLPSAPPDPHYVFLVLPQDPTISEEEYRSLRRDMLQACCLIAKLHCPEAQDIVGIATENHAAEVRSEDALYLDASSWTPETEELAKSLQKELKLLVELKEFRAIEKEYPDWQRPAQRLNRKTRRADAARLRRSGRSKTQTRDQTSLKLKFAP